jgi:hypothetical protein
MHRFWNEADAAMWTIVVGALGFLIGHCIAVTIVIIGS